MDSKKAYKILKTARGQTKFLRDIWGKFNAYADKNEWVRPAAVAAAAGLGGAGIGALFGGGKGALAGGAVGTSLGGAGGYLWDLQARDQKQRRFKAKLLAEKRKLFAKDKQRIEDSQNTAYLNLAKGIASSPYTLFGPVVGGAAGLPVGGAMGALKGYNKAPQGKQLGGAIKGGIKGTIKGGLVGGLLGIAPGVFTNDIMERLR